MENGIEISNRERRFQQKQNHINKMLKIAKSYNLDISKPHKFAKLNPMTCGNSNCIMCGNPRKIWGIKTMQERKFNEDSGE
jgi:hypothetical protein